MIKKLFLSIVLLVIHFAIFAQEKTEVDMADKMRANGKIYVVVAVILTIFAGIIIYLIRLDRKMSRLENNIHS
jgi:cytochrome bd-type quinol oxidase subunit 2